MNTLLRLSLLVGLVLGLAACSTISTRINEKSTVFYSLDANTRAKIAHGDVGLGFTPDMVYIALGAPDVKRHRVSAQGSTEIWIYRADYGYQPYWGWRGPWGWDEGWGWGGYYGGRVGYHHRFGSPGYYGGFYGGGYWPGFYGRRAARDEDTRIAFQNGRVVSIEQPKR